MTAHISIELSEPSMSIKGIKGIEILVDGGVKKTIAFGTTEKIQCSLGVHIVQMRLHGVLVRDSNRFKVNLSEHDDIKLKAKYSTLWGKIKITSY